MSILVTDELNNLKVYHYDTCDLNSPDSLKDARGIIKNNNAEVCKSFPFTPEITTVDTTNIEKFITPNLKTSTFYECHEGSIVRLWYYEDTENKENSKWYLSTHKKIDAFSSKWGSTTTYGETFVNILSNTTLKPKSWADEVSDESDTEENKTDDISDKTKSIFETFCNKCNKNYIYIFLIRNTDSNRVVVRGYKTPEMYCLGMFDRSSKFKYLYPEENFVYKAPPKYTFTTFEHLINYVNSVDIYKYAGVLLITKKGQLFKLVHPKYDTLFKSRGNVPNVTARYLELRNNEEELKIFVDLYPEFKNEFHEAETILTDVSKNIFKKYLNRYVYKKVCILPPIQFKVLTSIHYLYTSKTLTRIQYEDVVNVINKINARELYNIIKNYRINKKEYGNGNFVSKELKQKILSSIK
jgi:hypothetical protein